MLKKLLIATVLTSFILIPQVSADNEELDACIDQCSVDNETVLDRSACRSDCRQQFSASAANEAATGIGGHLDNLIPPQDELFDSSSRLEDDEEVKFAAGDLEQEVVPTFLKIIIQFSSLFIFGLFTYAGIRLILARNDEEALKKAKDTLIYSVVGAAIIGGSLGMIVGVLRLFDKF